MTAQTREILIYNNEEYRMANEPLDAYFAQLPSGILLEPYSSACWRGYIGTWEIKDNKLFLTDFNGYTTGHKEVGLDFIFPDKKEVFAEWVNGEIWLPHGEMVNYIHSGYDSIYEKELILKFEKGVLMDERLVYGENTHQYLFANGLDDFFKLVNDLP